MATIAKGLGGRFAEIARPVKERSLSLRLTTVQVIGRVGGNFDQAADGLYR